MTKAIFSLKNLFRAVLLLALVGACAWAWRSAGGSFTNLWLTPDQQGARLMARQHYAEAARHFQDALWQGTAFYRDGQFKEAAVAFARVDSPEAAFDRGNALVMAGKYAAPSPATTTPYNAALTGVRPCPTVTSRRRGANCWSPLKTMREAREGNCRRTRSSSMTGRSNPVMRRRWR
jgi:hypothetical protein